MPDLPSRYSWKKRLLLGVAGLAGFLLLFVVSVRITVSEMFRGIASSRATGLSAMVPWDSSSMWSGAPMMQKGAGSASWIARSADLRMRCSSFEHSVAALNQIVSAHHGYLEELRSESRSGFGRSLSAMVSVPSDDFDAALSDLQKLGRVEAIDQEGEDATVKLATAARRLAAAQTNLVRLQKLQHDRKGELRDAVALEKEIAQADEALAEAARLHEGLLSTVAQAHIRISFVEDYRAPLQISFAGTLLPIRNALTEGIGGIFSSLSFVLGILLGYGLPLLFWFALLFLPLRALWRRFRPVTMPQ
jgi:VIT1/CCC1 family predicted Fe2+/Mn2+ transporter